MRDDESSNEVDEWMRLTGSVAPYKHLHALGVLSAAYNNLEFFLMTLLCFHLRTPTKVAKTLFASMTNDARLKLLRTLVQEQPVKVDLGEAIECFAAGYAICTENRNFLMHSTTAREDAAGDEMAIFKKASRANPAGSIDLRLDLRDIRKAAEEIVTYNMFGFQIVMYIALTGDLAFLNVEPGALHELPAPIPLPKRLLNT